MKYKILIVEDDLFSRDLLCDWLEMEGFEIRAASDLKSAIAAIQAEAPDLILLDVKLGTDDGLALVSWIRGEPGLLHIPVIGTTAHAMITDRERVLRVGCNVCLSKPLDFKLLRESMQRWLIPQTARQLEV